MMTMVLVLAALAQDEIDNPEFKGWKGFKPGSSVTFKVVTSTNPQSGEQKLTLKTVEDAELVLETEMSIGGQALGKAIERKVPAKVSAAKAPQNVKKGEEEIEVAGKKLKCVTREFEVTVSNGKTIQMKIWGHEEIPGMAARIDISGEGGFKNSMVAASWEKK